MMYVYISHVFMWLTMSSLVLGVDIGTQSLKALVYELSPNGETADFTLVCEESVEYDSISAYSTVNGVCQHAEGWGTKAEEGAIWAPVGVWIEALEIALDRLKSMSWTTSVGTSVPLLSRVVGIGGSAQQHAAVYWRESGEQCLQRLRNGGKDVADRKLVDIILPGLLRDRVPIWMDMTTTAECQQLERAMGGPEAVAERTGSRAHERFTFNQILHFANRDPSTFLTCSHIELLSSFGPSLLTGTYSAPDRSDSSGMNCVDLKTECWDLEILGIAGDRITNTQGMNVPVNGNLVINLSFDGINADMEGIVGDQITSEKDRITGEMIRKCLGEREPSSEAVVGEIGRYWVEKFGFPESCTIAPWSGDNPSAAIGLGLSSCGHIGVSLGTSDTLFALSDTANASAAAKGGHILLSPLPGIKYMALLCYVNGSLERESVAKALYEARNGCSAPSKSALWEDFNAAVESSPPGSKGFLSIHTTTADECLPHCSKSEVPRVWNAEGVQILGPQSSSSSSTDYYTENFLRSGMAARMVLESRFLSMRVYMRRLGIQVPERIYVTGGASLNPTIRQQLADCLQAPVYWGKHSSNTAAGGGAVRAAWAALLKRRERGTTEEVGDTQTPKTFEEFHASLQLSGGNFTLTNPNESLREMYAEMAEIFEAILEEF